MAPTKKVKLDIDHKSLESLMRTQKEKIGYKVYDGKSNEFQVFKRVTFDGSETMFVVCANCDNQELIKYDTKLGSANLSNHLKKSSHISSGKEKMSGSQPKVDKFIIKSMSMTDRQRIYDAVAVWCACDNRPFNIVEGQHFKKMFQTVINVIVKYGNVNVEDVVPSKSTVRNHIISIHSDLVDKVSTQMRHVGYVNATTDHWKDTMSGASYMTICIHYVDDAKDEKGRKMKKLKNRIIGTFEVGDKTAQLTRRCFDEYLVKFNVESMIRLVITDNASNMIKAFEGMKWVGCVAHNMCLLQKYAFNEQDSNDAIDPFPSITKLILSAKSLVTKIKRGNFSHDLICKLKQEVETRWDTRCDLLESVSINFNVLANDENLRHIMNDIPIGLLNELLQLLKPLKEMRMELCCDQKITFNLVVPTYLDIQKLMTSNSKDSPSISILKRRFLKFMSLNDAKCKFPLNVHHVIATFLTPEFRSTPEHHINSDLFRNSMKLLKSYVSEIPESDNEDDGDNQNVPSPSQNRFQAYREVPVDGKKIVDEISEYEKLSFTSYEINMCPFEFWSSKRSSFPRLSEISSWILSCPATSSSSERVFSKLGNIVTPSRNLLNPEMVDKLSFVASNNDLM